MIEYEIESRAESYIDIKKPFGSQGYVWAAGLIGGLGGSLCCDRLCLLSGLCICSASVENKLLKIQD